MKLFTKEYMISLGISEINFAKKKRGKNLNNQIKVFLKNISRRQCVSKVAKIFDLTGKTKPITAIMKIDLQTLADLPSLKVLP